MAKVIDGQKIAATIRQEIADKINAQRIKDGGSFRAPGLAVVIVGDDPASHVYVRNKTIACEQVGFSARPWEHKLPENTSQQQLLGVIEKLNEEKNVHGILVQMPLPKHIDEQAIIMAIDPCKDVDGFHPINVGKMMLGQECFLPCTPAGVQQLLIRESIPTAGAHVVVVGRSNIVGKPMAMMMVQKMAGADATVTIVHSRTKNIAEITKQADILIAAIGVPQFIKKDMVKEGVVVIDVGINRVSDTSKPSGFRLVGDVDFDGVVAKASAITPVPGGVGPMTIAMLLQNTLRASRMR